MNRISVNYPDNFIEGQAFVAFKIHYDVTQKHVKETAEQHWKRQPQARELWCMIVMGILSGAETFVRGSVTHIGQPVGVAPQGNAAKALLARIGQASGPMSRLPAPPKATEPPAEIFPDDPRPDRRTDPEAYRNWKTRNFGRLYGIPQEPAHRVIDMSGPGIPPGLAIDRACLDPEDVNRDEVLDEALRQHQEGEDE